MKGLTRSIRCSTGVMVLLAGSLIAACSSDDRDPILGTGDVALRAPTVTAVAPVVDATGVPINNTIINAAFSEPMSPIGGASSFFVSCAAPCTSPGGSVALDASSRVATYTLAPGETLEPLTLYTATITGARSLATGLPLASPYIWQFTTGVTPDTTRPRVILTEPVTTIPGPTPDVPTNTAITAVFSEDMDPDTIDEASFTLSCVAPCIAPDGVVGYTVGTRTAVFTPDAALANATTYTATIVRTATDLAGNQLAGNQVPLPDASDYVWTFATAVVVTPPPPPPPANVSVLSTQPVANATAVCPDATINATFSVPSGLRMDPATISTATFSVVGPAPALTLVNAASVMLDIATGRIATFTPVDDLLDGGTYTATLEGGAMGVRDLAVPSNGMLADFPWSFTVGPATGICLQPVALGAAAPFGIIGDSAGMTNQGTLTLINGDIGTTAVSTAVTGFHDAGPGCTYTETGDNMGTVNGLIYTAPPPPTIQCPDEGTAATLMVAQQAAAAAQIAYDELAALPANLGAANLAGLTLAPGVYTAPAPGGSFRIEGGDLTLDAQGNTNAVWVFQMATTLTVGGPGAAFPQNVLLINGAQAKNVFWQVGSAATINAAGGGTVVGTIIAQAGAAVSTAGNVGIVTINGRLLSLGASVTLVNTIINVPAP